MAEKTEKKEKKETPAEKKAKKSAGEKDARNKALTAQLFEYYEMTIRLRTEQLGSVAEASIWDAHIIKKAQKAIKRANKLSGRLTKVDEEFVGPEISEDKHIKELQLIINSYHALIGETVEKLPETIDELLELAHKIEDKYKDILAAGEISPTTIFMKIKEGDIYWPVISRHMLLGNIKKNARVIANNGDKSVFTTKVSIGEVLSLDVEPIEEFFRASNDIIKDADGKRILCERPVSFPSKFASGETVTAILRSEVLPAGTEYKCTLRVRKQGPMIELALKRLFMLGKSQGLGPWRSSGGKGQYDFKLEHLPDYEEVVEGSEDGWM
jgi:hypothetical protein